MKRFIVDMSSVVKRCLYAGKDTENGVKVQFGGKEVLVNSHHYGYDNSVNSIVAALEDLGLVPSDMIMVTEAGASKILRQRIYSGYKAKREEHPPESNEAFVLARDSVVKAFRELGAVHVTQPGVEGDDVIAYLVQHLDGDKIIFSGDGDMARLISPTVSLYRGNKLITDNPYGPFDVKHITLMKALVGDGDEFKGAKGFGPKAWLDLLVNYGEHLDTLESLVVEKRLDVLKDDIADFPPFAKVVEHATHVYESYACAQLHPEWVNTLRTPLQWTAGIVLPAEDYRLRKWGQQVRLVTADNYDEAVKFLGTKLSSSPYVSLDIETSTPDESDEWLERRGVDKVDVLGSELTGLGMTFGNNCQYTLYFSVDHRDTNNVTVDQIREAVELVPKRLYTVVHNASFELPILHNTWGKDHPEFGDHGFLPNVLDTAILSSYVDENKSQGLKSLSSGYCGYTQTTYEEVTTKSGVVGTLPVGGKVVKSWDEADGWLNDEGEPEFAHHETRQYKMNELTGQEVLAYGADDTICTAALFNFFRIIMEVENTWDVMLEVEQLPAYVSALAFTQGTKFSLEHMLAMESDDKAEYTEQWQVVREALINYGWEGTKTPVFSEMNAVSIKEAVAILLPDVEFKTMVRTPSKLAKLVAELDHANAPLLSALIESGDVGSINEWVAREYSGEPIFDVGSPKQMKEFLYTMLDLPVRILNSPTENERISKPLLTALVYAHKKVWAGTLDAMPTEEELESRGLEIPDEFRGRLDKMLIAKAKTDDTAVDFALALDRPNDPVLKAFQAMKKCSTRQTMFYNSYKHIQHWKDGKIHGQAGQSRTVTRRYAPSDPNLAQLPKKGEGVKFRENFLPHKKDAVMVSIDFAGQELRQGAGQSLDANMLACFVGDNLKDMHSMTASGAMEKKWGRKKLDELISEFGQDGGDDYALFLRLRKLAGDEHKDAVAKLADDLRKSAKNVNFGAQYDAQAPKLAETLVIPVADAQTFLDAKFAMFPRFEEWKDEVKDEVKALGYATTCMGARRHLREALLSDNKWDVEKALRQGPNFKIQGSSAEQTKLAIARVWRSGVLFKYDVVFFAPIHDELVFSVHKDHAVEVIRIFHDAMTQPYGNLPVPFLGSISLGPNFGEQYEAGDEFIEENIKEILAKIFGEEVATTE